MGRATEGATPEDQADAGASETVPAERGHSSQQPGPDRTPLLIWSGFALASIVARSLASGGWALDRWDRLAQWGSASFLSAADAGWSAPGGGILVMPGYPMLVRATTWVTGDRLTTAVLISYLAGASASWLLWDWMQLRGHDRVQRIWGVVALLAFPYSFVLFGVIGPDALVLALVLGVFVLAERDRFVLAGLVGAAAIATQVVAIAVIPALGLLAWSRARDAATTEDPPSVTSEEAEAAAPAPPYVSVVPAVLLPLLGLVAASLYSSAASGDRGAIWGGDGVLAGLATGVLDPATWLRIGWINSDVAFTWSVNQGAQTILVYGTVLLAYLVLRKYGTAYAALVATTPVMALVAVGGVVSMGRYLLPAFPLAALAGVGLSRLPRAGAMVAASVSAACMLWFYVLYVRSVGLPYW
jgi:hypothetical protein